MLRKIVKMASIEKSSETEEVTSDFTKSSEISSGVASRRKKRSRKVKSRARQLCLARMCKGKGKCDR